MEFTKEAWENAPEGARLEYLLAANRDWAPAHFVGYAKNGIAVIETNEYGILASGTVCLRIILPKRKVTVQLWQSPKAKSLATKILGVDTWDAAYNSWTLLGEHTFEIEGE